MSKTLTYVIMGKDELTPVLKKAGKEGEAAGGSLMSTFAKTGVAALGLATVVGGVLLKSVKDARAEGWVPLEVATKNAGLTWSKVKGQALDTGKAMQSLGFDQGQVNTSLKQLITVTGNSGLSMKALGTAADFARYKNIDLTAATGLLASAAAGNTRALKQVGIATADLPKHFAATGTAASRMGIVMDLLNHKIGGQASAYAGTFGGKLAVLKAQMTNVSATVGMALIPVLSSLLSMISKYLVPAMQAFGDWFTKKGIPAIKGWAAAITPVVKTVLKDFFTGLKTIIGFLGGLPGPIKIAGLAVIGFGVAMRLAASANPWMLLATAIVILVGLIVNNWTKIKSFTINTFSTIMHYVRIPFDWLKANWPLLLVILTGPIGLAALAIARNWSTIRDTAIAAINVIIGIFKTLINVVLDVFGGIVHGAAAAFGWVPGVGGKLKTAARAFDQFKADVNSALGGINNKSVTVSVAMTASSNPYAGGISGRAAAGSLIRGPGGPTSDTAGLFALSDGEYVVRASSVSRYGVGFMNALNAGRLAGGGGVNVNPQIPAMGAITSGVSKQLTDYVQKNFASSFAGAAMSGFGTGGSGGAGVQRWAGLVMQVLAMLGQSPMWLSTVLRRMNQESGGNQFIVNNWDSNAMAGHPSMGLMQTIPGTFNAYAGPFRGLGIFNPLANIYAGMNYAIHQYGSLAGMNRAGGYDNGGWLMPGATMAYNNTGQPERVLKPGDSLGNVYNVTVNVGSTLASKQEIGRVVADALRVFKGKGGNV